jgi:phosphatidylserine decarboxylase
LHLPITRYGAREIGLAAVCALVAGVALWTLWPPLAAGALLGFVYVLAFFRDPLRAPEESPLPEGALLSPADGTIDFIGEAEETLLGGRVLKISIFLSVFDVHLNRAPCSGTVEKIEYRPGEYLDARRDDCSSRNEANAVVIAARGGGGEDGKGGESTRVLVRQVSGAIARRIVFTPQEGEDVSIGERIGMIKFGSRTDLCVPIERAVKLRIMLGQHVSAGHTVMGVMQ